MFDVRPHDRRTQAEEMIEGEHLPFRLGAGGFDVLTHTSKGKVPRPWSQKHGLLDCMIDVAEVFFSMSKRSIREGKGWRHGQVWP